MNREEFEQFVMNCGKDILRFCRLTAGGRETGDELYQDTMLALLEKGARLDPVQNTKSYALSVAILLWKNKKRKYANRRRLVPVDSMERMEEENGLDPPDDSAASPDEYLLREDERRTVQKIVAELPEKYRLPIQLYYTADMSVQEIADIMRIPEGTVKSRMSKARSLLKKELEALGYDR